VVTALGTHTYIIIGHGRGGIVCNSQLPDSDSRVELSTLPIVESQLVIVVESPMHDADEFFKLRCVAREQVRFIAATIVEEINTFTFHAYL